MAKNQDTPAAEQLKRRQFTRKPRIEQYRARELLGELRQTFVRSAVADGMERINQGQLDAALGYFALALHFGAELPDEVVKNRRRIRAILGSHQLVNQALFHDDWVSYAEFSPSPDSRYILTISGRNVLLWKPDDGTLHRKWEHSTEVLYASFDHEGKTVLTSANDGVARIWSVDSNEAKHETRMVGLISYLASFDAQSERILMAANRVGEKGALSALAVWKPSHGSPIEMEEQAGLISMLTVSRSPGAPFVVTASKSTARLWNFNDRRLLAEWHHDGDISAIAFSGDGAFAATGGKDSAIQVRELPSGSLRWSRQVPANASVLRLRFSRNDKLLTASTSRGIVGFEAGTGRAGFADTPEATQILIPDRSLSPDLRHRLIVGSEKSVRVVDLAGVYPAETLLLNTGEEIETVFADRRGRAGMLSKKGVVTVWDQDGGILFHGVGPYKQAALDPKGVLVLVDFLSFHRHNFDKEGMKPTSTSYGKASVYGTRFLSADGRFLAAADPPYLSIQVWDTQQGLLVNELPHSGVPVMSASFSSCGNHVVTMGTQIKGGVPSTTPVLWETRTARKVATLPEVATLPAVSFSDDGRRFAVPAVQENVARVFASADGQSVGEPFFHQWLRHAAISSSGDWLLTCGSDVCRIWDVSTGQFVVEVSHANAISHASFSPDDRAIITAGFDKLAHVWDISTGQLLHPGMIHESPVDEVQFTEGGQRAISVTRATRSFRVWRVGDDTTWSTKDLILAAEFLSSNRVTENGLVWLDPAASRDAWTQLNARHPEVFRCTKGQELQFLWKQALASQEVGEWESAIQHLERLLSAPDYKENPTVIAALGYALLQLNREADAEAHYKAALEKDATNASYHENLATAHWRQGKFGKAAASYERAIELRGGAEKASGWVVVNLGSALAAMGKWPEAIANLEQGIKNGRLSSEMRAYRHLALSLLAAGRSSEFEALRDRLVNLYGATQDGSRAGDVAAILVLMPLPRKMPDGSKPTATSGNAIELATRANKEFLGLASHVATLGAALYRAGRSLEATQFIRHAIQTHENKGQTDLPREWLYLSMAEAARGNMPSARAELARATEWLDRVRAATPPAGRKGNPSWDLVTEVGLLAKEAQGVIDNQPPSPK
jgi:WD40 repeat protein/tetratricopeptide (TPR) repeat protein